MELCWRSNKLQEQATSSATLWQMQHVSACCSCSTMLALTCVSVASGRLPGSQSGHARQLTDPACKCGQLICKGVTSKQGQVPALVGLDM